MRRFARATLAFGIGLLFALACAEFAVSFLWSRPVVALGRDLVDTGLFTRDTECGWLMTPNTDVEHHLHWGESVRIHTNGSGFRDREFDPADRRPRVVVIGDSFPFGYGVEAADAFPTLLQGSLPEHYVLNCGQTGYNLGQSRALLERFGETLAPHTVVLSFCMNDVEEQTIPAGRARARVLAPTGIKAWLDDHSSLYALAKHVANHNKTIGRALVAVGLRDRLAGYESLDPNLRPFLREPPEHLEACWRATFAELDAIEAICRRLGAELVVALVPARQTIEPTSLETTISYVDFDPEDFDLDVAYERVAEHCERRGLTLVRARDEFAAATERGESLYLTRDMHFNPQGNALFAAAIARALRQ